MAADRPAIIIAATPTSNGDLHVGHLAGPYLAGDVYARYLRAQGRPVVYTTCTDDSQTYVVTTAHRRGMSPATLCAVSTAQIERSLAALGISMPGLPPIDDRYRETVLSFVTDLYEAGKLRLRTVRMPYAGTFLYDGLVRGTCPACLAGSSGGACEDCGHPNSFDELLDPRSTLGPDDPVDYRETEILVLPMEDYRDRLVAYFDTAAANWRPHARQLLGELLAGPLPDVPVTVPGSWGIAAPFAETPGQILYPWIEAMPAVIYSTWWSADPTEAVDERWREEHGAELVYFHGFDNVYHWGLMDLTVLLAHGGYVVPAGNVCNEFYELAGEKFSTSRNHLISAGDLLAEVPRDLVRFYLALTSPEHQRTNFDRAALDDVTRRRLVTPWNALADALALATAGAGPVLTTSAAGRRRAAVMARRFGLCYELGDYSLTRAAETIVGQLVRLAAAAASPDRLGDLLLEVRTLLAYAAPILIDAADRATGAGVDLRLAATGADLVPVFDLPRLPDPVRGNEVEGRVDGRAVGVGASS